jgi:hypothetical protein
MKQRGRKSSQSLSTLADISAVRRPDPPATLTDEQADEWRGVVDRLPAEWFGRETHPLLEQYCRHVVRARRLAQLLDACELATEFDIKEYRELLSDEIKQSTIMQGLATRMRISQASSYDASRSRPVNAAKPWDMAA